MMWFGNDITMCTAVNCPRNNRCYRFMAKPEKLQSYADFSEVCYENKSYEYFYPLED